MVHGYTDQKVLTLKEEFGSPRLSPPLRTDDAGRTYATFAINVVSKFA